MFTSSFQSIATLQQYVTANRLFNSNLFNSIPRIRGKNSRRPYGCLYLRVRVFVLLYLILYMYVSPCAYVCACVKGKCTKHYSIPAIFKYFTKYFYQSALLMMECFLVVRNADIIKMILSNI